MATLEVTVEVETPLKPTEDPSKVRRAMLNLFPDLEIVERGDGISGRGHSLERFRELLFNQRIRDSAREIMLGAMSGPEMVLHLSKQAAYAGRVSFSAESPLGALLVIISGEDLAAVVDSISPSTLPPR